MSTEESGRIEGEGIPEEVTGDLFHIAEELLKHTLATRDRLTMVATINYESTEHQALSEPLGFEAFTSSQEQPFVRRFRCKDEWTPIETGWIDPVGTLIVVNRAGKQQRDVNPTEEELEAEAKMVVRVRVNEDTPYPIPPGEFFPCHPPDLMQIKADVADTPVQIIAFAK